MRQPDYSPHSSKLSALAKYSQNFRRCFHFHPQMEVGKVSLALKAAAAAEEVAMELVDAVEEAQEVDHRWMGHPVHTRGM